MSATTLDFQKVPAWALQRGDLVGSGEVIVSAGAHLKTPRGMVEVVLEKDGRSRSALWNAHTIVSIRRAVQ